ncbi:MAG: hypothetical protein B6I20_12760 [Bacteroidetes bacterium 4572_117]|nr:MAG: hypothetical protein B6I20_12760 [Bacteroidetes bacterium 4572_117]
MKGIDGDYYFGDWDRNKYNGFGSLTIAGGDKYIGNFKNGKYEGSGKLNTADGTQITGEFKNGKIEGTANIEKKDGTKYYGEFDKGEYEGEGNLTLPNGDFYKGEFKNGKFNKHGILYYSKGGYFNGGWWNGRRYGLGEEVDANGNIIEEGKYGGKKGRLLMTTAQMKRAQVAQDELLRTMRGMQEQMAYQKKQQSEYQKKIAKRNSENDAILAEYTKISKARSQYLEDVKAGKMNYDPEKYKNPYKVNSNTTSQNNTVNNTNTSNNNTSINKTTVKKTVKLEPKYKVGQQVTVINKGVNINDGVKGNYPRAQIRIAKVLEYDKYFHKKYPFQEFHMIESRSAKRNNIAYIRMEDGFEYQYIIDGWAVNEAYEIRYEALYNNKVLKELWVFSSMGEIIEYRKGNNKIIWRYGHENNGISVICYQISNGNNYASYKFGYNPSGKHTTTWFSKKQYQFSTGEDWQWVRGEREESAIQEAKAFLPNLFNYKSFKPQKRVY